MDCLYCLMYQETKEGIRYTRRYELKLTEKLVLARASLVHLNMTSETVSTFYYSRTLRWKAYFVNQIAEVEGPLWQILNDRVEEWIRPLIFIHGQHK